MTYNVLTLFPEMFSSVSQSSIWRKAIELNKAAVNTVDIRDYSKDKHRRADDYPFGGGSGMVLKPEPIHACFEGIVSVCTAPYLNIYMSPGGKPLTHHLVLDLMEYASLNILCGHYEGVDARVLDRHVDMEISIGDFVLTGGELAAMVLIDACIRHIEGVLGNNESVIDESFSDALLEHPQYTRPAVFEDSAIPEVLLSGHHENVAAYRRCMSLYETAMKRPDLLSKTILSKEDIEYITQK
ncbi:MAG: tRNA (guanosine(37)-N1)-methyltransferase TrmD [Christensenellales bacterium]